MFPASAGVNSKCWLSKDLLFWSIVRLRRLWARQKRQKETRQAVTGQLWSCMRDRQTPEAPELSFLFAGNRKRFYSADTRLLLCILLWDAIGNPRRNINAGFWERKTQMMVVTCNDFNHPIVSKVGRPYTVMTQAISDQEKAQRRQPGPWVPPRLSEPGGKEDIWIHSSAATPFTHFGLY